MTRRAATPPPAREKLQELRDAGATRESIAELFGVSLTTVKRWIAALGINKPPKRGGKRKQDPTRRLPLDEGVTLIEQAKAILGKRLTESRWRGYLLDGRPTHTDALIEAAGLSFPPERIIMRRQPAKLDPIGQPG